MTLPALFTRYAECNNSTGFDKSICSIKRYWRNILHLKIERLILEVQSSITRLFSFHTIKPDASHYTTSSSYLCIGMRCSPTQTSDFSEDIRSRSRSLSMEADWLHDNYTRTGFSVCPKTLLLIRSAGESTCRQKMNWLQSSMHCLAIITWCAW